MSNIIDFKTREAVAVGKAKGLIEQSVMTVDIALENLLDVIIDNCEELAEEEVADLHQMTEAIGNFYTGLLRNPRDYPAFLQYQEICNQLDALSEMEAEDEPD